MPIYDFICPQCEHEVLDELVRSADEKVSCPNCNFVMRRKVSLSVPHTFPSDGVFLRNVSATGKTFYSKQEMRDWEKKTGGYIDCCH